MEVSADKDGKKQENFDEEGKIIWLGEFVRSQNDGRFCNGCYIEPTDNFQLIYDGPEDNPECFKISISLWDNNETE